MPVFQCSLVVEHEPLTLSVPWVLHLQDGDDNSLRIMELLRGLNELLNVTFFTIIFSFIPHKNSIRKARKTWA